VATLLKNRDELLQKLGKEAAQEVAALLVPVAAEVGKRLGLQQVVQQQANGKLAGIADKELSRTYAAANADEVKLVDYWPRNELHLLPTALYPYASLPYSDLASATDKLSYATKADALEAYVHDTVSPRFKNSGYILELSCDIRTLFELSRVPGATLYHPALTPRHGYAVPTAIDDHSDEFDAWFDASMQLYSELQAAGYEAEAPYATLLGHTTPVLAIFEDEMVSKLQAVDFSASTQKLVNQIIEAIATAHPILAESYQNSTRA
jgi:hypothetical protein